MASIEIQKITQELIDGQISVTKADRLIEAEFKSRVKVVSDDEIKKMAWEYSKKNITIQYDFIEAVKWFLKNKKLKQ